jgi:hypothetical protein
MQELLKCQLSQPLRNPSADIRNKLKFLKNDLTHINTNQEPLNKPERAHLVVGVSQGKPSGQSYLHVSPH